MISFRSKENPDIFYVTKHKVSVIVGKECWAALYIPSSSSPSVEHSVKGSHEGGDEDEDVRYMPMGGSRGRGCGSAAGRVG